MHLKRILIIDDDAAIRRELSEVLAAEGYTVSVVADGRHALNHLQGNAAPSLILLDLMMPVMDGWDFILALRSQPTLAQIPVVVMSCLGNSSANTSLLAGYQVLRKPLRRQELLEAAARHSHSTHPKESLAGNG